jgi:hypothetical protein
MLHNVEKVTLMTSICIAATETSMQPHAFSQNSGIEHFINIIIVIYNQ